MTRHNIRVTGLLAAFTLAGCASAVLLPAPGARTLPGDPSIAMAEAAGVRLTVQADAWPGSRSVLDHVHALRVTIENRSVEHIRVRYGDFALVTAQGRRSPAVPPIRVDGDLLSPTLAVGFTPIMAPRFTYRRFYVAPYFGYLYPGVPIYPRPYVFYDPGYYAFWYDDFARSVRNRIDVLSLAIPEGVIEPDGQVSGFLYFRTVDPDAGSLTFRASIIAVQDGAAAIGGRVLGDLLIPFTVRKER